MSVEEIFTKAKNEGRNVLTEFESKELLHSIGINIPKQILITDLTSNQATLEACKKIGYPVAMKLMAVDIIHKSDAGAVKLDIKDESMAQQAYEDLMKITGEKKALSIQEMAKKPISEIIIGSLQDPQFGPTVMFGIGGVLVEVMKDVAFRIAPITDFDADEMITENKGYITRDETIVNPVLDYLQ